MRLTPPSLISGRNNINFGYNKKLNKQLVARLEQNPDNPINRTLLEVNQTCNNTEDNLKHLEGRKFQNYKKNENSIILLTDYFLAAKAYLARTADRLFPDLAYSRIEAQGYSCDAEDAEILFQEQYDGVFERKEADWRCQIANNLGWNELIEFTEDDSQPVKDLSSDEAKFIQNLFNQNSGSEAKGDELVKKFTPFSYSPKSLDDVVGLSDSVEDIKDLIIYPLQNSEAAVGRRDEYGIEIPGFAMFFGPPGCGKTMLVEAIAAETGCDMYSLDLSKFGSSYVNGTASNIAKAFDYVIEQAKDSEKPVILFMDELDSVLSKRTDGAGGNKEDNKAVNALLPLLTQAKENNILVIGATNMFDSLDPAAKRRVDMTCYIGLPKEEEISELLSRGLNKYKKGKTLASDPQAIKEISKELVGYSPSNINKIIKAAFKKAYKAQREVEKDDFKKALKEGAWEKIDENEYLPENRKKTKNRMGF